MFNPANHGEWVKLISVFVCWKAKPDGFQCIAVASSAIAVPDSPIAENLEFGPISKNGTPVVWIVDCGNKLQLIIVMITKAKNNIFFIYMV